MNAVAFVADHPSGTGLYRVWAKTKPRVVFEVPAHTASEAWRAAWSRLRVGFAECAFELVAQSTERTEIKRVRRPKITPLHVVSASK